MLTDERETVYGISMPVWQYSIVYACGCERHDIRLASNTPIPEVVQMEHDCPDCYTGPYANVWD